MGPWRVVDAQYGGVKALKWSRGRLYASYRRFASLLRGAGAGSGSAHRSEKSDPDHKVKRLTRISHQSDALADPS
jgi:hypothetical protein